MSLCIIIIVIITTVMIIIHHYHLLATVGMGRVNTENTSYVTDSVPQVRHFNTERRWPWNNWSRTVLEVLSNIEFLCRILTWMNMD